MTELNQLPQVEQLLVILPYEGNPHFILISSLGRLQVFDPPADTMAEAVNEGIGDYVGITLDRETTFDQALAELSLRSRPVPCEEDKIRQLMINAMFRFLGVTWN